MAKAEFTQGQSIQRRDPVTREEGHLEDTGRIWVSWYSWAPGSRAAALRLSPAALSSARQDGNVKTAWGLTPQDRRAVDPKPSVWVVLMRPSCANKKLGLQ